MLARLRLLDEDDFAPYDGGGSQIYGMNALLQERTEMKCMLADDADSCVAYGCGRSLAWINHMQEDTINIARRRLLRE